MAQCVFWGIFFNILVKDDLLVNVYFFVKGGLSEFFFEFLAFLQ